MRTKTLEALLRYQGMIVATDRLQLQGRKEVVEVESKLFKELMKELRHDKLKLEDVN